MPRNRVEAMLYYLYMAADGNVTYSEEKVFDEICRELELEHDEKQEVIQECNRIIKQSNANDLFKVVVSNEIAGEVKTDRWFETEEKRESRLARIVWNLVNLGYADTYYSEEEKKIVHHIVEQWEVKKEVYQEFVDIADTMLALTKQKAWVLTTYPIGSERDEKEEFLDTQITKMMKDVHITIEELAM